MRKACHAHFTVNKQYDHRDMQCSLAHAHFNTHTPTYTHTHTNRQALRAAQSRTYSVPACGAGAHGAGCACTSGMPTGICYAQAQSHTGTDTDTAPVSYESPKGQTRGTSAHQHSSTSRTPVRYTLNLKCILEGEARRRRGGTKDHTKPVCPVCDISPANTADLLARRCKKW